MQTPRKRVDGEKKRGQELNQENPNVQTGGEDPVKKQKDPPQSDLESQMV